MLFSSSNTGSTDLRDTEVQQPNTTATLSCVMSWRAFSAKSGQFEAGSTTTGSIFMPITPPLALISSNAISAVSFSTVSLIAMVPDSECSTPTLMGFCCANACGMPIAAIDAASTSVLITERRFISSPRLEKDLVLASQRPCQAREIDKRLFQRGISKTLAIAPRTAPVRRPKARPGHRAAAAQCGGSASRSLAVHKKTLARTRLIGGSAAANLARDLLLRSGGFGEEHNPPNPPGDTSDPK